MRVRILFLFLIECLILFAQIVTLFLIPIDPYRELNSDGTIKAYFPIWFFFIFITLVLNVLFFVLALVKKKLPIKMYTFLSLIFIYIITVSLTLFLDFGPALREFEIKTFFIFLTYNLILLTGYFLFYRQITK